MISSTLLDLPSNIDLLGISYNLSYNFSSQDLEVPPVSSTQQLALAFFTDKEPIREQDLSIRTAPYMIF